MSAEEGSCKNLWIFAAAEDPTAFPGSPAPGSPALSALTWLLLPASIRVQKQKVRKGKKKKKIKKEISRESINSQQHFQSLERKGAKHTGQTLCSTAGRGNLENCLQPLIDTNPCFSFLPHQNVQSSIFLGLPQLLAAAGLAGAAQLPWASSQTLHFSGKAPKKILT